MKKNKIYLINKLSSYDLDLLKKDFLINFTNILLKIKNIKLAKNQIEEIIKNNLNKIIETYDFAKGQVLSNVLKMHIFEDVRTLYEKTYPDSLSQIKWPNMAFNEFGVTQKIEANRRIKELHSLKNSSNLKEILTKKLTKKQQRLLSFILDNRISISYTEIASKMNLCIATISNNIRIIYSIYNKIK